MCSLHSHITDPCAVCALYEIFVALNKASEGGEGDTVEPTSLRLALSKLYPDSNFFQEVSCESFLFLRVYREPFLFCSFIANPLQPTKNIIAKKYC